MWTPCFPRCSLQLPQFRTGRLPPPPLVTVPQALRYEQVAYVRVGEPRERRDVRVQEQGPDASKLDAGATLHVE